MKNQALWLVSSLLLTLFACETDDVMIPSSAGGPDVSLSLSNQSILENAGSATLTATLSASSTAEVIVDLSTGGTAVLGTDYNLSDSQIRIPSGSISATITISALDDAIVNGSRSVIFQIAQVSGGQFIPQSLTLNIEDDDGVAQLQLIFNEVLYDPSNSGLEGDANGDGQYSQADDEFLEIVNIGAQSADLSGFKVYDDAALTASTPRHLFASGTVIPPGKALVLFGGGTPTGNFGGALVQTSTTGNMNLNNAGDVAYLYNASDSLILSFDINPLSGNPNESYTRSPDLTGDFEQHATVNGVLFSPGTRIDGTPF